MENYQQFLKDILGFSLRSVALKQFHQLEDMLLEWNKKINLTSITNREEVRVKHFIDSLTCFNILPISQPVKLIDIGAGAGFPGIPLKIANPAIQLTLVDSVRKKVEFCRSAANALGYTDVETIHARVEDIGQDQKHREKYDWGVARAVGSVNLLCEYLLPLVKIAGNILIMKGLSGTDELTSAARALKILGGEPVNMITLNLPNDIGTRRLIHIRKTKSTPPNYPRKPGIPKKRPLV